MQYQPPYSEMRSGVSQYSNASSGGSSIQNQPSNFTVSQNMPSAPSHSINSFQANNYFHMMPPPPPLLRPSLGELNSPMGFPTSLQTATQFSHRNPLYNPSVPPPSPSKLTFSRPPPVATGHCFVGSTSNVQQLVPNYRMQAPPPLPIAMSSFSGISPVQIFPNMPVLQAPGLVNVTYSMDHSKPQSLSSSANCNLPNSLGYHVPHPGSLASNSVIPQPFANNLPQASALQPNSLSTGLPQLPVSTLQPNNLPAALPRTPVSPLQLNNLSVGLPQPPLPPNSLSARLPQPPAPPLPPNNLSNGLPQPPAPPLPPNNLSNELPQPPAPPLPPNNISNGLPQPPAPPLPPNGLSVGLPQPPTPVLQSNNMLPNGTPFGDVGIACRISTDETHEDVEETKLKSLLKKLEKEAIETSSKENVPITVAEFSVMTKRVYAILEELEQKKVELGLLVRSDEKTWNQKVKSTVKQQVLVCDLLDKLADPSNVSGVLMKIKKIRRKRAYLSRKKNERTQLKMEEQELRKAIHAEIDRFHEGLRDKDEQKKRQADMQKEADCILSEVRKKIQEAKQTLRKLKLLEKCRQSKKDNAVKKGMLFLPTHDRNFESKLSNMREVIMKQLSDYEAEERALKVMLETEQEGQLDSEVQWRIEKRKRQQEKRQSQILSALFGDAEIPTEQDPMHQFYQFYNKGSFNIESLIEIRRSWDMYLVPTKDAKGSNVPQQWVVPTEPSSDTWASVLQE